MGFDIEKLTKTEFGNSKKRGSKQEKLSKNRNLANFTRNYISLANAWLKNNEHIREIQKDVLQQMDLGIHSDEETLSYVQTIKDCLEIVQWYLFMIAVKFNRALSGKLEDDGWEEANGFQKDSDGSAKVALISTQRTFDAWLKLFELLPNEEQNLIPILGLLQKILKKGEEDFPNAKNFIRPGFDEVAVKVKVSSKFKSSSVQVQSTFRFRVRSFNHQLHFKLKLQLEPFQLDQLELFIYLPNLKFIHVSISK